MREGSLEAPIRHPIDWKSASFYDSKELYSELERVYDICHGCRRCVSLCHAFPTLFDLIDESDTMEVDGVKQKDYWQVVDQCFLCDLCYMTKCPYVPPHEWNVDFPNLMLRAKVVKYKDNKTSIRDKVITSTDTVGNIAGIPVVTQAFNTVNRNKPIRKVLDKTFGIHADAVLPTYYSKTLRKRFTDESVTKADRKVALFVTCYGNYNMPAVVEDLIMILRHNNITVSLVEQEKCCGMPKLELGDLEQVEQLKSFNIPKLKAMVDDGWDILAPIPSCVLMFKQHIPLLFPQDEEVKQVQNAIYDPFEYLMKQHKSGKLNTEFKQPLGHIAYHAACHQRVQNIGAKTKELLQLIPDTKVTLIERCSGHDGVYAVKSEYHDISMKICKPIVNQIDKLEIDHYISDCPMAGDQIEHGLNKLGNDQSHESAFSLIKKAYNI